MTDSLLVVVGTGLAAALLPRPRLPLRDPPSVTTTTGDPGWMMRYRVALSLLAAALAAGAAPASAAQAVADALPGPGGARLGRAAARLRLGADPVAVWQGLADEPALAPLGRALARGQSSGSSVVVSVRRLGDELARAARADAEDRARRVGVKAAVPLGACLLPSFLLIGIVPLVGGLLTSLRL